MSNVRQINYILQINSFERWLESNFLPAGSQLLWYKLMAICNRSGWQEWIQVDAQRLMNAIGETKSSFMRSRDSLLASGLIEYRRGKKGHPSSYKLVLLYDDKNAAQNEPHSEPNPGPNPGPNPAPIDKQKEKINCDETQSIHPSFSLDTILESINFEDLKRGYPRHSDMLGDMERIIVDMWHSKTVKIDKNEVPQSVIRYTLSALNYSSIEYTLQRFLQIASDQHIHNPHGYLRALIYRSALACSASLEAELCEDGVICRYIE